MMAETEYVLALSDPQATALAVAGGKGASLARLSAAGMPVPEGFIVSTVAYRRFVEENNLEPAILTALEAADASQPTTLEATSRTIRELFSQAQMHQDISAAIVQSYVELGGGDLPIAVRSSATAEDLPGMSFAGQQETYLNVRGEAALLDAVKRCWASLWTARAIAYRLKMGIDHRSVAMAVVVQTMVPSEVSGVLFTANPTSGERDELVINASFGLGESVVSGRVTPDSFVLDKSSLALKDVVLGTKGEMIVPADGQGTITRDVPEDQRVERSLSEGLLRELGKLAIQVEKLYEGVPQDIEWAVSEGRCYLLQARPMTGLPPAPLKGVRWESPIPGMKWVRRNVAEHMPEPLSPLFEELYLKEGMELAMAKAGELTGEADLIGDFTGPWYATVNGYAYLLGSFKMTWGIALKSIAAVFSGKMIRTTFRRAIPY
ncbi:MAG: PEP/pyruvate-binding domain-containing protein, partial [Chloroflexota bacterium]